MNVTPTTYLCDACVGSPPTWRYDIPPGTPIGLPGAEVVPDADGQPVRFLAAGSFGMCDACHAIMQAGGMGRARKFAQRMVHGAPMLQGFPAAARGRMTRAATAMFERMVPLLSNPRPCVRGEDPLDAKVARIEPGDTRGAGLN